MSTSTHPSKATRSGFGQLSRDFFARRAIHVARDVLGKKLVRREDDGLKISGWISETEAYVGPEDLASHACHGRTQRNAAMWGEPGHAYVYFTYGMHWMLNLVTETDGQAGAVLVRGLLPDQGLEIIRRRRNRPDQQLTDGPAKLCQALGIDGSLDGHDLCDQDAAIFLEPGVDIPESAVTIGPRVGLNHVPEPWLSQPWRFRVSRTYLTDLAEKESGA